MSESFKEKLLESCIPIKDSSKLGLVELSTAPCGLIESHRGVETEGFIIKYYDINGGETGFFRYRFFKPVPRIRSKWVNKTTIKTDKYSQPPGTSPGFYYTQDGTKWLETSENTDIEIIITEGELKAICGCINGYTVISIGGVWCWKSGGGTIKDFDEWKWDRRIVNVMFDSDGTTNPEVRRAEGALLEELTHRGAVARVVRIPELRGQKTALDDYIRLKGTLDDLLDKAEGYESSEKLHGLNKRLTFVRSPVGYMYNNDGEWTWYTRADVEQVLSNNWSMVKTGDRDKYGNDKIRKVIWYEEWMEWQGRSEVKGIRNYPGNPDSIVNGYWNQWPGWGCEAVEGDITPFKEYFGYITSGLNSECRKWLLQWLAYPIQHPGYKLKQAVLLWSQKKRNGKSTLGYTMKEIYGKTWIKLQHERLGARFNDDLVGKQFVMADELSPSEDKRVFAEAFKGMVTEEETTIEEKFKGRKEITSTTNFFLTSNHNTALYLEEGDGRVFVHHVTVHRDSSWFKDVYYKWLREEGGAEALRYYFENNVDTSTFNPEDQPPYTEAKEEMIESGRSMVGRWVARLKVDPDGVLSINGVPYPYYLWTAEELYEVYTGGNGDNSAVRTSPPVIGRELLNQGFLLANGNSMGRISINGSRKNIWVIRSCDEVAALMTKDQVVRFYYKERDIEKNRKKGKYL